MWPLLLALILAGPEQVTGPYLYDPPMLQAAAPAVALAEDAHGAAMAWAMRNADGIPRIHVARLDRAGRIGTIRELPAVDPDGDSAALYPSLTRRGGTDGFLLTWIEDSGTRMRTGYALLDAALAPTTPRSLFGYGNITSAPVAATGAAMWITSGAQFWHIETDGSARGPFDAVWPASDMTATAAGVPLMVSGWRDGWFACAGDAGCVTGSFSGFQVCKEECRIRKTWLRLVVPYGIVEGIPLEYVSDAEPALASDGDRLVMTWFRRTQKSVGDVVAAVLDPVTRDKFKSVVHAPLVLGQFAPDTGATRPDIAVNERGTYVVWRTMTPGGDHDIAGAFLGRDGTVEPFTVADSPADERDPSILALENGALLVAYRKADGLESRVAWRVIGAQTRRRAVR
jgi:hypothetical protein